MKKYAAHYLFPGDRNPIAKGIIKVDPSGLILELINPVNGLSEQEGMEFHNGIICPAFVNVFHEFEDERFFRKFPLLQKYNHLKPERLNTEKDILSWIKAIQRENLQLTLDELIRIFTLDAAKSIKLEKEVGSLEKGKRPGLMLISGMDYRNLRLSEKSYLKMLI
jgi:hypothetical protein